MTVTEISSTAELHALCASHSGLTAVLLWAPWHPPSVHLTTKVLDRLAADKTAVRFGKVNTDVCGSIATSLGANQVPFVAFFDPKGNKLDTLAGPDAPALFDKVTKMASRPLDVAKGSSCNTCPNLKSCGGGECGSDTKTDLNAELKGLINYSTVMLFMKGSKLEPFCKFSKQAVGILNDLTSPDSYCTFDILQNDTVREGLKEYSNWKTYPQLYIQGELIGGVDIIKEMNEDGSLKEALEGALANEQGEETLEDRMRGIINREPVMLMMKGNPEEPKCGFSRKMSDLLKSRSIQFGSFDILSDQEVREGLKSYSNWQTYPQLYSRGKLIGGLDIVLELDEEGSLFEEMGIDSPEGSK